ncbi:aldo/keto reductase [Conexibacter sp. CPCC 206217]|uniref:aldo/keto reductase n=1 Tax=Conexibacter sp. CPCC 206217 TaxID=3064574 RepID=UPI002722AFFD|nr:aldo/keto reductase [Conexibacter sp. CPCC 206217]MDO8212334.1 aldo/keto reductase [Conexibacter sp. CPCC 206217]
MVRDGKIPSRAIGSLQVGAIGLGCMTMAGAYETDVDDERSIEAIHRALELGVTLIDTADAYGAFSNERLLGRALVGHREAAVVATKVGLVPHGPADRRTFTRDGSVAHVREGIDGSLERLGVDHVDLYQLHRVDPEVPLEETWGAMAETVQSGKAREIGLSEVGVEELERAHAIHPVASVQSELSLWERGALAEVLPWCAANGVAFIPFAPLGRGYLTGTIAPDATLAAGDWRTSNPRFTPEALAANAPIVERVRAVAQRLGATPAQVALAWTLAQDDGVVPIPGTRRPERVEENAGSALLTLSTEDLAQLDALPAVVGARY